MKKFIGSIKRTTKDARSKSDSNNASFQQPTAASLPQGDHPEAVVVREAFAFCEAGAPGSASAGDEYLHLPAIVDACESSPSAAREAASSVQRYLSKQNFHRGYAQYNAVMLMRILTDNPGHNFTQYFDKSFVSTVKALLRECKDSSVQQIMRETLDYFEAEKLKANDSLTLLVEMWRKEKGGSARMYSSNVGIDGTTVLETDFAHTDQAPRHSYTYAAAPGVPHGSRPPRSLPPPDELAARIEEAKTSARLLVQMVQSTPPTEMLGNDLIKEFAERARQANKSVTQYMACENPAPDEHTMLTLIETSEQLSIAMTKHQRAVLNARKATGLSSTGTSPQPQATQQDPFSTAALQNSLPPQPPRQQESLFPPSNQYSQPNQFSQPTQYSQPITQAQQQQYQPQRQPYGRQESDDLYSNTPIVSPIEANERTYAPPSGPPPQRKENPSTVYASQPYSNNYETQQTSPVQASNVNRHSATAAYDIAENPFADDNAYTAPSGPPPPRTQPAEQNSYSLFNRAAGQLRDPASPTYNNAQPIGNRSEAYSDNYTAPQSRPQPTASNNWQPTPSFVGRQQSSEAHITMSGASPPQR